MMEDAQVTGTLVWYFYICKREVWLMSRHIVPDQDDENILIGRFLQEFSYSRLKKEVSLENVKLDVIKRGKGNIVVGEVKKSSRYLNSAKMQLVYYLLKLKEIGIVAEGELLIPEERKKEKVILCSELEKEIYETIIEIKSIIYNEKPPAPIKISFCNKCAYSDFCWI